VFTLFGLIDNGCERFSIEIYCQYDLHIHRSILNSTSVFKGS